jgi:hypothetical protein
MRDTPCVSMCSGRPSSVQQVWQKVCALVAMEVNSVNEQ